LLSTDEDDEEEVKTPVITKETCFGGLQVPISSKASKVRVQMIVHASGKVEVAAWEVSEGGKDGEKVTLIVG
jgi:hypothetical protein